MNDKDKEAFKKWMQYEDRHDGVFGNNNNFTRDEWIADKAWQAACEYKNKEIDELNKAVEFFASENTHYFESLEKLQAENAKLRECVEEISKMRQEVSFYIEPTYPAILCIEVLKELDKK